MAGGGRVGAIVHRTSEQSIFLELLLQSNQLDGVAQDNKTIIFIFSLLVSFML